MGRHLWTGEELVLWLTYEEAKEPVKSSPSPGSDVSYLHKRTTIYVHVRCACYKGPALLARFLYVQREVEGNLASALGVKMIYVIRLIKRLSARRTSELHQVKQTFAIERTKEEDPWITVPNLVISRTNYSLVVLGAVRKRGQIRRLNYDQCFSAYLSSKHPIASRNYWTRDETRPTLD